MITRIAIDEDAITESHADAATEYAVHERLVSTILERGVIVCREDIQELFHSIANLPSGILQLWNAALSELLVDPRPSNLAIPLKSLQRFADLQPLLGRADLIAVSKMTASNFGIVNHQCSASNGGIEVGRADLIDRAQEIRRLVALDHDPLRVGNDRESIWSSRFKKIAGYARHLAIVDKYALTRLAKYFRSNAGVFPPDHIGDGLGIAWFLAKLNDESSQLVSLSIFTCDGRGMLAVADQVAAVLALLRSLGHRRLPPIKVWNADRVAFDTVAHDRHLRFQRHCASIGQGFQIFDGGILKRQTSFSKLEVQYARDTESVLERSAGSPPALV